MLVSSLLLMSGLACAAGACSTTEEPVKPEEPTIVPDPKPAPGPDSNPDTQPSGSTVWRPEPNGNKGGGSAGTNQKKQLKTGLKV